jgi:hypothetical protein
MADETLPPERREQCRQWLTDLFAMLPPAGSPMPEAVRSAILTLTRYLLDRAFTDELPPGGTAPPARLAA